MAKPFLKSQRSRRPKKKKSRDRTFPKKRSLQEPLKKEIFLNALETEILSLVYEAPHSFHELEKITSAKSSFLKKAIEHLQKKGFLARLKNNCFTVPKTAGLVIGKLQIHAAGNAHILSEKESVPDLFIGSQNIGTAMNNDLVLGRSLDQRRSQRGISRRAEGMIIQVLERANNTVVGTFHRSKDSFYVLADDPRFTRRLTLSGKKLSAKSGDKVVAALDHWEHEKNNPEGHLLEVLGSPNQPEVAMLSLIRKHQLPGDFPKDVLREAHQHGSTIDPKDLEGREDLRHSPVITIDPDDARDFDDAIEVQPTNYGWNISIHIADVAHYVQPNSALDREARKRGNSVYLVDRVIPMLPENLSNGLCSLRPNEDRLAFSIFVEMDRKGIVRKTRFARTVIRSIARLTYQEAFQLLQKKPKDEISRRLHTAWDCSSLLRQCRFKNGALDLEMPEIKIHLDAYGTPIKLERVENDISHQLIEELMLLANELVARHLKRNQAPTLYRVHEKPDLEKLDDYRELITSYGLKAGSLHQRGEIQKLLYQLQGKPYEHALKIGLLKSLKRARYTPEPLGHYGLQKKDYSHFTSPIRRYADLITHRSLAKERGLTKKGVSSHELFTIGNHLSTTERTANDAEKESIRLKILDFFELQQREKKHPHWKAIVIEARSNGLLIELPKVLISGFVPLAAMNNDYYFFDARRSVLIGERKKRIYRAGDIISVMVDKVDRWKQQVDFRIF